MHSIHHSPPRARRAVLIGTAALALALLPAMPAAAHDQLVSATPAAGTTVRTLDSVDLAFSAAVLELGGGRNAITVTGDGGRHFETACASIDGAGLSVPVALGGAGAYTVTWRAVSSDGHPVGDSYAFYYRPADGANRAEGRATSPCATADAVAQPTASTGSPIGALITGGIAGAVLLAAVVAVLLVVLRGRRGQEAER